MAALVAAQGLDAWRAFLQAHAAVVSGVETRLLQQNLVPLTWYDVLLAIRSSPRGRIRMSALADELVFTRSGATRLVDKLERAKLVRRETATDDRRGAFAALTPSGRRALARAWPVYARGINELFLANLTQPEIRTIEQAFTRVTNEVKRRATSSRPSVSRSMQPIPGASPKLRLQP